MPSRLHWAGKNNRSQHNLVGSTVAEDTATAPPPAGAGPAAASSQSGAGAPNPPSASPNPAFSSSESFQPDNSAGRGNHTQQAAPPSAPGQPHLVNIYGNPAGAVAPGPNSASIPPPLQHSNSVSGAFDSRQRDHDFADQVTRSQSHRLTQISPTSTQHLLHQHQHHHQQQHQQTLQHQSPPLPGSGSFEDLPGAGPQPAFGQQQQQPQPQPPKTKQSTRKLIKNILRGPDQPTHAHQNSFSGSSPGPGPARRNSKRNPQDVQHPTIRPVPPSEVDSAPYSADDVGYRQRRSQVPPELQHQQYGQAAFEANPHHQQQHQQQQQQQYQFVNPQQPNYQGGNQPGFTGLLGAPQQQNPETVSQLSHESPATDSDQRSAINIQAQTQQSSPTINYPQPTQDLPGRQHPPPAAQAQASQQQTMPHPAGGPQPTRRSQDAEKGLRDQVQPPPGPPPSYRQSQQGNMNPLPQPPNAAMQNPNFRRSDAPERHHLEGQVEVQGRNSPQPPPSDRPAEDPDKAFKDLLTKYKNVKRLYFDGKKEIEHLNGQVEQLQNAIANQRISQSRTSLDDNEYTTRFNRLNGAINNLSFNIRKDWVSLPQWLVPFVSPDALKTGKQEMTAIGRAVITRWIVDEIFNRCFHPGLDPELSRQLKLIEHNIRHFSYTMNSQEEYDALTSKVVSWRMATLEGLQDVLRSSESVNHRNDFTRRATSNLTACLFQHLTDPPPPGVDGSASMIVELAVGIASNLPLESRDVAIIYPLPEQPISPELMEIEKTGLPPLETRPPDASEEGGAAGDDGNGGGAGGAGKDGAVGGGAKDGKDRRGGDKRTGPPAQKDVGKVRFAGFVAVEVRGRQVLVKAPVWTLA